MTHRCEARSHTPPAGNKTGAQMFEVQTPSNSCQMRPPAPSVSITLFMPPHATCMQHHRCTEDENSATVARCTLPHPLSAPAEFMPPHATA
jgi:hypothetical protein